MSGDGYEVAQYLELLEKTVRDIDAILSEYENEVNHPNKSVPSEIRFDAVPIVKKLREAQKEARLSLSVLSSRTG